MKAKYTPGPWYYPGTGNFVGGADRLRVADCYIGERQEGERKANARLISAAPDLLEALKGLINCHTGAEWQTEEVRRNHWIAAQEAIAKAEQGD